MSMFPIASYTFPATTNNLVRFDNIPQNFTHLQLRIFGRGGSPSYTYSQPYMYFNSDTTAGNYRWHSLSGNGTTVSSSSNTDNAVDLPFVAGGSSLANVYGSVIVDILDYTNTNKLKTIRAIGGFDDNNTSTTNQNIGIWSGLYLANTNAITRLDMSFYSSITQAYAGSRFDLYGISTSNATGA